MDKEKKKLIKRILALVCAVTVVAFLAAMPLLAKQEKTTDGPVASILSGKVQTGDIRKNIIGGGTLTQQDGESVTVPAAVKLTKLLVKNGDVLAAGDAIAQVDRVSVMQAITQVQETLEYLANQISKASDRSLSSKVTAQAGGTVKQIFAEKGESVQQVMLEHGALAILSLDGRMSVTLETEAEVKAGASVQLTLGDKTVAGTVESSLTGTVKVVVDDNGYTPGQQVTVHAEDTLLGTGILEINSPWRATAYAGTVEAIKTAVEKTVENGDTLMTLSDTGHTAAYQQLVDQHTEYEEMLLQLFTLYQTQLLTAPCDGVVSGIEKNSAQLLKAGTGTLQLLANAPDGNDEAMYIHCIGQIAAIGQNGWAVLRNPEPFPVADYKDLSGINTDPAAMTQVAIYDPANPAPLYERVEDQWVQLEPIAVQTGDLFLFAGDEQGNFVWLVRVKKAETSTQPEGTQPGQGQTPGQTQKPEQSQTQRPSGSIGSFPQQEEQEEFEVYSLETAQIATVTPQGEMTLQIAVDEMDILKLQLGQQADITVDALTGAVFTGTITDIGNTGTSNGGNSKFTVELTLERSENMLSGMNATATIPLGNTTAVPVIPVAALAEQGLKTIVYTGYDEKDGLLTGAVEVTVGASDGEQVEILSGLSPEDTYYYAYYDTLTISNAPDFGGAGFFR